MRRPFGVTFLVLILVLTGIRNAIRLADAILFWESLNKYGAHPLYIAFSAGIWFNIVLFLAWGLLKRKSWIPTATITCVIGYATWYWFDRLIIQRPHANWAFAIVFTMVSLLIIYRLVCSTKLKQYFRETYG
jgi:hypothetical protein